MKYILLLIVLSLRVSLTAQVTYIQDSKQGQLYDNPSFAGADASSQLRLSYNNSGFNILKNNSYQLANLFYDKGFTVNGDDILGLGFGTSIDRAGESQLQNGSIGFIGAYHIGIKNSKRRHFLSLGTSVMGHRLSVNEDNLRWSGHIDSTGVYNPNLPDEEVGPNHYVGLDVGLSYNIFWNNHQYASLGISVQDLNEPNNSLFSGTSTVERAIVYSAITRLQVNNFIALEPYVRYFDMLSGIVNVGSNLHYAFYPQLNVFSGLSYHDHSRYSVNLGGHFGRFRTNMIYTWSNASPSTLDWRQVELSMAYRIDKGGSI